MQDFIADFLAWFSQAFAIFADPPYSALFIMAVSVMVTSISQLATRRFTDMRRLKRYQAEIKQFQAMQKEAEKTQNEKLLKKVRRRKAYIDRIQRESMTDRCKPSLLFMIPFLAIFTLLRSFYIDPVTGIDRIVVVLPFNVTKLLPFLEGVAGVPTAAGFGMTFYAFYFLVGLGLSSIMQRIFGTQIM
ncbi:MAG: EMC3/TMCO1 family protein [Candidatus Thorarchaeota archaeon]